jgi:hypothetical protein
MTMTEPSLTELVAHVPTWTGAMAETQADVDAALERLRGDGAPGHWLAVAPQEPLVVDHAVVKWLLVTAPALPAIADVQWIMDLEVAAKNAGCPVYMSERLVGTRTGKSPGMELPKEVPTVAFPATDPEMMSMEDVQRELRLISGTPLRDSEDAIRRQQLWKRLDQLAADTTTASANSSSRPDA